MISVDEYQDIDAAQYDLLRLLAGDGAGLTVIGDPDQAIYGFRGGDVGFFLRFGQDYPAAATRQLSAATGPAAPIVAAAAAAMAPATLVPGRRLQAVNARPAGHRPRGGRRARRGGLDQRHDRRAARRLLVPLPGQRPGQRSRARRAEPGRHRGALPHRRPVGRARPGPGPLRPDLPQGLPRPAPAPHRRPRGDRRAARRPVQGHDRGGPAGPRGDRRRGPGIRAPARSTSGPRASCSRRWPAAAARTWTGS